MLAKVWTVAQLATTAHRSIQITKLPNSEQLLIETQGIVTTEFTFPAFCDLHVSA